MRHALGLLALIIGAPATAQALDGNYVGQLRCKVVAAAPSVPLLVQIRLTVAGTLLRYESDVLNPNSAQPSGVKEIGSGTVAPPVISMSGRAKGATYAFQSAYRGTITAAGVDMSGSQKWYFDQAKQDRSCTISAKRR